MKKITVLLLVMMIIASLITGCATSDNATPAASDSPASSTGEEITVKELKFASPSDISSFDPRNATGTNTAQVLMHMFSSIVKTDENGAIVGDLAETYENVDDITWKFKLKEGITFHDGSPLTSEDVAFTLGSIRNSEVKYKLSSDFAFMTVNIIDDLNFEIVTDYPYPALLLRLNYVKILPSDYIQEVGDEAFAAAPIGSGPFKFVEWVKDEKVELEAYENYFGGKPALDKVTYMVIPEAASRIAALESGDVDLISNVETSQVPRLESDDNFTVVGNPTTRVVFVGINTLIDSPLQDAKVRQALNYAVDKNAIILGVLDGYGNQVATISTPEYDGFDASIEPFEYNPEKAKALLAEAGYADGFDLEFTTTSSLLNGIDVSQAIAAQLGEVGINVTVQQVTSAALREQIGAGTISPLYLNGIGGPYSNIDLVAKLSFSSGERYSTFADPEFDTLRETAASTVDPAQSDVLLSELQRMAKDKAPAIFLYQQYGLYAYNNGKVIDWSPRVDEMIVVNDADVK